jgi:Tfp pilus assembly protein PilO
MAINNRVWVLGALVLTVAIVAASWFIGISPVIARGAAAESERASVAARNAASEIEIDSLRERSSTIGDVKALVEGQRKLLPTDADLPNLLGQLDRLEAAAGVTLTDFSVSDGIPFVPVEVEPPAAPTDGDDASADPSNPDESASTEPVLEKATEIANANLVTGDNFIAIPVSVSALGGFEQVMAFVASVQSGERLFLVTELTVAEQEDESGGGAFTANLTGFVYVLLESSAQVAGGADVDSPSLAEGAGTAAG